MMKQDLQLISDYYERNKLTLNLQNTQALIVGNGDPQEVKMDLNKYQIKMKDEMIYLGVI